MADKKILEFKLEIAKLEGVIDDLKQQISTEIDRKRELNGKKIELIKAGNKKAEVQKINKDLLELNSNVLFLQEEMELMREHIAEVKQERVMELIAHRDERYKEMLDKRSSITQELEKLKFDYLQKVHEIAGTAVWDMKKELWDLNDVIRNYGDGNRMSQPRLLMGIDFPEFSAPRPTDGISPFVMKHELEQALRG